MEEKESPQDILRLDREERRRKVSEEIMGEELKEGKVESLRQLAESVERGESELKGWDEEGNLKIEVPSKEGDIESREVSFKGKERDFLVGALTEEGVEIES